MFQNDFVLTMSSKSKTPWITLNGVDTADSEFAIDVIKKHFNVSLDSNRTSEEIAHGHAIRRMVDEGLYW